MLDPNIVFLNHGSFGACPIPVFETYQNWQLELERQPVDFLGRRADTLLETARGALGDYLNVPADELIFVPNATIGINTVARSLQLQAGDEILTSDHEYGAMDYTWEFMCRKTGAVYIHHPIPLPVESTEEVVESFWSAVTPRTRVIFLSHITSPTALILPIEEICRRAREAGIITVIDGAHAPGQLSLDLSGLGADFYTGNCHKWLCAPKGSGFLYARREHHPILEPLVVSWGWLPDADFVKQNQWQGTRDIAAFLSVPAAIDFQQENDWETVRYTSHELASAARERISSLFDLAPVQPDSTDWFMQLVIAPLPECDPIAVKAQLYDVHNIEVPLTLYKEQNFIRVSFQGYNSADDLDRLVAALADIFRV